MKLLPTFSALLICMNLFSFAYGQDLFGTGARNQSLGDASSALSGCWSVFGNQAGLAAIRRPALSGSFQNRFLVKELSSRSVSFVFPVQSSVFAFSYSQFGQVPFRQEKMGIAYARAITSHIRFGVQFNRYNLYLAEENHSVDSYGLEIGMQYTFESHLILGAHILNPYHTEVRLVSGSFSYPSALSAGTFYQVAPGFGWVTEVENAFDHHLKLKTGFEYDIRNRVIIRAGVAGKPYQLSAGFGFRLSKLFVDLAISYNQYLGNSPSVSFQYSFE